MWVIGILLILAALGGGAAATKDDSDVGPDGVGCGCVVVIIAGLSVMRVIEVLLPDWLGFLLVMLVMGAIITIMINLDTVRPIITTVFIVLYLTLTLILTVADMG